MDEFSVLMWGVPRGADAPKSPKLQKVFGTDSTIEPGKIYGSIADGNARVLYQPKNTHPGDHISKVAIGYSIDWFAQTLKGGRAIASSNQIWIWKELGTFVGFIGFVFFILGLGGALLGAKTFAPLARALPVTKGIKGGGWWIGAVIAMAIPVLTFFPFFSVGNIVKASWLFPEAITSQIMTWALLNGLISLVLFLFWHFVLNKKAEASAFNYGLREPNKLYLGLVGRDLLLAAAVTIGGGLLLLAEDFFFKADFRLWILALKPLSPLQFGIFLRYVIPFTAFFLVSGIVLNGQMRLGEAKPATRYFANIMLLAGGFLVFLAAEYIPLFMGGTLLTASEPLNTIVAIQFLPLMIVAALVSTWFFERTGRVWAGAFVNGIFVTWYIVAGQAVHFPL